MHAEALEVRLLGIGKTILACTVISEQGSWLVRCCQCAAPHWRTYTCSVSYLGFWAGRVNKRGEPMLVNLNQTAHMHCDGVFY